MTREIPGSSSQHFYGNKAEVSTSDKIAADGNASNICMQTGEEFSPQFSRDRAALRRVLDQNQLRQAGFNYNQNNQLGYVNLIGTHGIRRKDSDSDAVDYVSRKVVPGHAAELENRVYNDNVGRYQWECVPNEQKPSRYADEMNSDGVTLVPTTPPNHVLESPWPCHPFGSRVSGSAFSGKMKFLCSFGGKILPRPNDGKLRYVGGETRIISIRKNVTWEELAKKTSAICDQPHTIKYQLPGEDLDALISVCSDEDLNHMIEEYRELERNAGSQRLRIFLVSSVEPDSPNSFEARTPRQSDADYQYVVAVNSMLDFSPHKSSSGQSSTFQRGTSSDYKNQSPSVSPVNIKHTDSMNNGLFYVDPPFPDSNECISASTGLMPLANLAHCRQYIVETDQTSKQYEMHHHNRSSSGDFLPYQLCAQSPLNADWPMFMETAFSDTQLQEHNEPRKWFEEAAIPLPLWNNRMEKSPSLTLSTLWPHVMNGKHEVTDYENRCNNIDLNQEVLNWMDKCAKNYYLDRAQCVGNFKASSSGNDMEHKNLPKLDCMPLAYHHPQDSQEYGRNVCITQVKAWENSVDTIMKHPSGNKSGIDAPNAFVNNQNVTNNRLDATTDERTSGRLVSHGDPGHLLSPSHGSRDQESKVLSSKSVRSTSNRLFPIFVDEHVDCPHQKFENVNAKGQSYAGPKDGEADLFVQPRPSDNRHDDKVLESMVIVEDVTGTTPTDTLLSSSVVPLVEEEDTSHKHTEAESMTQGYDSDDVEGYDRDINKSLSDAVMAEIEAGIYHLQIIKNADIEEVQELGSGTFGTVYFGKWRGTDVAIKRIKRSCFSGRSSEQERLTRDLWREARILSDLHHPNVLAFYGVVPDGPEGTMATVTEYMVNGSLRRVLQKDRTLDHYKKLVLALDAAFGMEYLHLRDIIHFDLKCDNLLVNLRDPQRPICKVGDFGLSKIKRNTLVSGGVRGTLPWMAPELLDGSSNQVSEKVDVYSFGIAMWEILTGEEPYANMQFGAIIGGIVNNTLRPRLPKRCDSEWRKLMEECWSFDPAARPSFTEITNRLQVMSAALRQKRRHFANR